MSSRRRLCTLLVALASVVALALAGVALGDTVTLPGDAQAPWSAGDAQARATSGTPVSPLELLASQIATQLAGHPVTVVCTPPDPAGIAPASDQGYINSSFYQGSLTTLPWTVLSGNVCEYLQQFAQAAVKPTKCAVTQYTQTTVYVQRRVALRKKVFVKGKTLTKTVWVVRVVSVKHRSVKKRVAVKRTIVGKGHTVTKTVSVLRTVPVTRSVGAPGPVGSCYLGNGKWAGTPPPDYGNYAFSILALAHEAMHLHGDVGILVDGVQYGEPDYEAEANCHGMQWMAYVAEALGDTPDDAQAIANYFWEEAYPRYEGSVVGQYWSADCVPGGRLDIRPAGSSVWP